MASNPIAYCKCLSPTPREPVRLLPQAWNEARPGTKLVDVHEADVSNLLRARGRMPPDLHATGMVQRLFAYAQRLQRVTDS